VTEIDTLVYAEVGEFCDFWHNSTLYLGNGTR